MADSNRYGWKHKIVRIDLDSSSWEVETPPIEDYVKFIGGRGLAGRYLKEFITNPWDSPKMALMIFSGPLNGTSSPTSGRFTIMSRSPLTGTIGDSSTGGNLGIQLKKAGFDGIIITGKASTLTGIEIRDGKIVFKKAPELAGKTTMELFSLLENDHKAVTLTGPAADSGVLYAGIVSDRGHFAGRNGLGAVMASKNLKYIAATGSGTVSSANPELLKSSREDINRLIAASPILMGDLGITNWGTGALYDLMHQRRMMPTRNFRATRFEKAPEMNAFAYQSKYNPKKGGCRGCHIRCKRLAEKGHIPEFETMSHFSALIDNDDMDLVMESNRLCTLYGMDTITLGSTLACYLEITEKTLKTDEIIDLIKDTAFGIGVGKDLGLGSARLAEKMGHKELSMSVKKQELPAYDPRGAYGMALAYATSTRGGCHLRAYPISHEILRKPVATDRFSFSSKARIIKISEDLNGVVDSLTACKFVFLSASLEEYGDVFTAVTGIKTSGFDLMRAGERIVYNERIMNSMNGFTSKDDDLPDRFFQEEGSSGDSITILPLDRDSFLKTRGRYYKIRGVDPNGVPTKEKATELGLTWEG